MLPSTSLAIGFGRASFALTATGAFPALAVAAGGIYLGKKFVEAVFGDGEVQERPLLSRDPLPLFGAEERNAVVQRRAMSRVLHRRF